MLAYDSFECKNCKTSIRESACDGAETAASVVNVGDPLNASIATEIMDLDTTDLQGVQQVDATK